ncbi:MAG TPA: hypothetical protein VHF22_14290, partial [Planctomycetota bacterium]|nr:hypothetical protein [Planctomycetota bacterium]
MKTFTLSTLALALAAAVLAPVAHADDERSTKGVYVGLDGFVGDPTNSYIRVARDQDRGDTLRLRKDIGVEVAWEARAVAGYRLDSDQRIQLDVSSIFLYGRKNIGASSSPHFGGHALQPNSELEARPIWLAPELRYERILFRWGPEQDGKLAVNVGLRADLIQWDFTTFSAVGSSTDSEGSEDFWAKPIVLPVIGVSVTQPILRKLDAYGFARGMRANHWPNFAFAKEGGRVYDSESFVEAGAGLIYRVNGHIDVMAGYRFLYIDYAQTSDRDGNYLKLS